MGSKEKAGSSSVPDDAFNNLRSTKVLGYFSLLGNSLCMVRKDSLPDFLLYGLFCLGVSELIIIECG